MDDLGYMLVCERSEGSENINIIETSNANGIFSVTYDQVLQSFDVLNRNGRMYDGNNVWDCIIHSPKIQSQLAHNGWFMELDHPFSHYKGMDLSPERVQNICYDRRCAVIKNPIKEGNLLKGRITTTSNDLGVGLAKDIVNIGYKPMASLRAIATMAMDRKPYVRVKKVINYDTVSFASHPEADTISNPKPMIKSIEVAMESAIDKATEVVKKGYDDIVVPLKEILESVARKDPNAQLIMESFDLDINDMSGIDLNPVQSHVIVKDKDNKVYINISPKSVHDINDYLSSF